MKVLFLDLFQHPNLVSFHGITRYKGKVSLVLEFLAGGDLQQSLDMRCRVRVSGIELDGRAIAADGDILYVAPESVQKLDEHTVYVEIGRITFPITQSQILHKYRPIHDDDFLWETRLSIAVDIARSLRYLHFRFERPFVHRDIRSPNVFLSCPITRNAKITAKLADFGLMTIAAPFVTGALHTFQWVAPESLNPASSFYDERSDVYSFGIVLFEIVSRLLPFIDTHPAFLRSNGTFNRIDCIHEIIHQGLRPSIDELQSPAWMKNNENPRYGDSWRDYVLLMKRCWAASPSDRPSFLEVANKLEILLEEVTGEPHVTDFKINDISRSVAAKCTEIKYEKELSISAKNCYLFSMVCVSVYQQAGSNVLGILSSSFPKNVPTESKLFLSMSDGIVRRYSLGSTISLEAEFTPFPDNCEVVDMIPASIQTHSMTNINPVRDTLFFVSRRGSVYAQNLLNYSIHEVPLGPLPYGVQMQAVLVATRNYSRKSFYLWAHFESCIQMWKGKFDGSKFEVVPQNLFEIEISPVLYPVGLQAQGHRSTLYSVGEYIWMSKFDMIRRIHCSQFSSSENNTSSVEFPINECRQLLAVLFGKRDLQSLSSSQLERKLSTTSHKEATYYDTDRSSVWALTNKGVSVFKASTTELMFTILCEGVTLLERSACGSRVIGLRHNQRVKIWDAVHFSEVNEEISFPNLSLMSVKRTFFHKDRYFKMDPKEVHILQQKITFS
jgi:serine/threonine protein kinase